MMQIDYTYVAILLMVPQHVLAGNIKSSKVRFLPIVKKSKIEKNE